MKFDIVVGGETHEFTVHLHGCRDVKKHINQVSHPNVYTVEAESAKAAVDDEVAEYQHNEQDWVAKDFRIMPCCGRQQ